MDHNYFPRQWWKGFSQFDSTSGVFTGEAGIAYNSFTAGMQAAISPTRWVAARQEGAGAQGDGMSQRWPCSAVPVPNTYFFSGSSSFATSVIMAGIILVMARCTAAAIRL